MFQYGIGLYITLVPHICTSVALTYMSCIDLLQYGSHYLHFAVHATSPLFTSHQPLARESCVFIYHVDILAWCRPNIQRLARSALHLTFLMLSSLSFSLLPSLMSLPLSFNSSLSYPSYSPHIFSPSFPLSLAHTCLSEIRRSALQTDNVRSSIDSTRDLDLVKSALISSLMWQNFTQILFILIVRGGPTGQTRPLSTQSTACRNPGQPLPMKNTTEWL